jgi:hypothetical protein
VFIISAAFVGMSVAKAHSAKVSGSIVPQGLKCSGGGC